MNKGSACGALIRVRVAKGGPVGLCTAHHLGPDLSNDMRNVSFPSFPAAPTAYPALPDSRSEIYPSDRDVHQHARGRFSEVRKAREQPIPLRMDVQAGVQSVVRVDDTCLDWGPQYDVAVERARMDP